MSKPPRKPKSDMSREMHQDGSSSPAPEPTEQGEKTRIPEKPIAILAERDIPFEEERPPNFSPHFEIRVHRVRRREQPKEVDR